MSAMVRVVRQEVQAFTGPTVPDSVDADSIFLDDPDFEPANDRERPLPKAKREREKREKQNN